MLTNVLGVMPAAVLKTKPDTALSLMYSVAPSTHTSASLAVMALGAVNALTVALCSLGEKQGKASGLTFCISAHSPSKSLLFPL